MYNMYKTRPHTSDLCKWAFSDVAFLLRLDTRLVSHEEALFPQAERIGKKLPTMTAGLYTSISNRLLTSTKGAHSSQLTCYGYRDE